MTTMTVMPRATDDWTVDDLDTVPDDGLRYELLDGLLLVTPAPKPLHQAAVGEVFVNLRGASVEPYRVYVSPVDWRPDQRTSLQPDVLVVPREQVGGQYIVGPLALAVEVLSPSTRRKDQLLKFSKYAEASVTSYWIVDPDEPSLTAYDLVDGTYHEVNRAVSDNSVTISKPFPMTLVPSALVSA